MRSRTRSRGLAPALAVVAALLAASPTRAENVDQALVVGINQYRDAAAFSKLKYSEDDARKMAEYLGQVGYSVTLITGNDATYDAIVGERRALARVCAAATARRSKLLVFFAGHGVNQREGTGADATPHSFICPSDVEHLPGAATPYGNVISIDRQIIGPMLRCGAAHKYLFVDACRDDPNRHQGEHFQLDPKLLPVPSGLDAIFSCDNNEFSKESDKLRQGVFTYYLLRGLRGMAIDRDSGPISISNLYGYLNDHVPARVKAEFFGQAQNPQWRHAEGSGAEAVVTLEKPGIEGTVVCGAADPNLSKPGFKWPPEVIPMYSRQEGRVFDRKTFTGTFIGVNFNRATFNRCRFIDCEFRAVTKIDDAVFSYCTFERADFTRIETRFFTFDGHRPRVPPWSNQKEPDKILDEDE